MSPALVRMFTQFDPYTVEVPLDVLADGLAQLEITLAEVSNYARFGNERYQRNLMHTGAAYEALLLCWKSGQRSPIHDHRGSNCAFRVLAGTIAETRFDRTIDGLVYPRATVELPPGTICATRDAEIHQVSNLQPHGAPLITLHIYSPPLRVCNVFSLTDPGSHQWYDPVFEFAEGSGI